MADTKTLRKVSKESVDYRRAAGTRNCGNCGMFHRGPGTCDLVRGLIRPEMVCDRWVKK